MKHLKLFEEFEYPKEKYPKGEFEEITKPKKPEKRQLTLEERKFMYKFFPTYSWGNPDANGYIILGGGEKGGAGKYYITEEDLANYMADDTKDESEETDR